MLTTSDTEKYAEIKDKIHLLTQKVISHANFIA